MKTRIIATLFFLAVVYSCVSSNVFVVIDPLENRDNTTFDDLVEVTLVDKRTPGVAASTREAAFGTPMGNIRFQPSEPEIVKQVLALELAKIFGDRGVKTKQTINVELKVFGVNTDTTVLYWDVIGRIEAVLSYRSEVQNLSCEVTERTYVWPGQKIIKKVVNSCLDKLVQGIDVAKLGV